MDRGAWWASVHGWGHEELATTKRLAHTQTIALRFTVFSKTDLYGDDFQRSQSSFECMSSIFFFSIKHDYLIPSKQKTVRFRMKLHFHLQKQ